MLTTKLLKLPKTALQGILVLSFIVTAGILTGLGYFYLTVRLPEETMLSLEAAPWRTLNVGTYPFQNPVELANAERQLLAMTYGDSFKQDPIPRYLLGRLHETLDQPEKAILDYQEALRLAEKSWLSTVTNRILIDETRAQLATVYYISGKLSRSQQTLAPIEDFSGLRQEVLLSALSARLEEPNRADFRFLLGKALQQDLRLGAARNEFEQAQRLAQNPQLRLEIQNYQQVRMPRQLHDISPLARYYGLAGLAYQEQQQTLPQATAFLKKAVLAAPESEWLHMELALAHRAAQDYQSATIEARKALSINPDLYHAHLALGDLDVDQARYTTAIQHFKAARTLMANLPDGHSQDLSPNIYNQIGFAQECTKQWESAQASYREAMLEAQALDNDEAYADYAYAQEALSRITQTLQNERKVLSQGHASAL